jgi:IS30 family transposase
MIDKRTVFEIHRLNNMQFSIRQIAEQLGLDRGTVKKVSGATRYRLSKTAGSGIKAGSIQRYDPEDVR